MNCLTRSERSWPASKGEDGPAVGTLDFLGGITELKKREEAQGRSDGEKRDVVNAEVNFVFGKLK